MIYESVINVSVSETEVIEQLLAACATSCIDVHRDKDHNRSVFTLASIDLDEVIHAGYNLVSKAFNFANFSGHQGVHPRLGIVDVIPFISYDEQSIEPTLNTIEAAQDFGEKLHKNFGVPVFFYDYACNQKTTLPHIRKNAFNSLLPNFGDSSDDNLGSVCIGAREPLVAINVNFDCKDLQIAKRIAKQVRESNGGFEGVRAIGLNLDSREQVQVSMNIVDTKNVNLQNVLTYIMGQASEMGFNSEVELVGLMPMHVFESFSQTFGYENSLTIRDTIEYRLSNK